MAKFSGNIGFNMPVDKGTGIYEDFIVERHYRGEILSQSRKYQTESKILGDIECNVRISILSDDFLRVNLSQIRYLHYSGSVWTVKSIEPTYPRIVLTVGGVYNGPQATTANQV